MKKIVPAGLALGFVVSLVTGFAASAADGYPYHAHRVLHLMIYGGCRVSHVQVVEIRHYRITASYLQPMYYCGGLYQPDPSNATGLSISH